jgi:hypothetical protein
VLSSGPWIRMRFLILGSFFDDAPLSFESTDLIGLIVKLFGKHLFQDAFKPVRIAFLGPIGFIAPRNGC